MAQISSVAAHMIFDSRGVPTIQAVVKTSDGITARSAAPTGISKSVHEAHELRDDNPDKWQGMGVTKAVETINTTINSALSGQDVNNQKLIDKILLDLDGTPDKSKLGANTLIAVSQAVVKAAAYSEHMPLSLYIHSLLVSQLPEKKLPTPLFNVLEGGKHAPNNLNFQEFLLLPAGSKTFNEKIEIGAQVYQSLKKVLVEKSFPTAVADQGGFCPETTTNLDAINLLKAACDKTPYKFSLDLFLGIDSAASSFYGTKKYKINDHSTPFASKELVEFYAQLFTDFGILYFEDPMAEDDLDGWKEFVKQMGGKTMIVGDDLTATHPYQLQIALENGLLNGIVIKPNQIGTVTETIAVIEIARFKGLKIIVSCRDGETGDTFIADFALGVGADYVKFGAPAHTGAAKYNRILDIAHELSLTS